MVVRLVSVILKVGFDVKIIVRRRFRASVLKLKKKKKKKKKTNTSYLCTYQCFSSGGGERVTGGIRQQIYPSSWELDRVPWPRDGKLAALQGNCA